MNSEAISIRTGEAIVVRASDTQAIDESKTADLNRTVAAFLSLARERWQTVQNAENKMRRAMLEDWRFRAGDDQWDPLTRTERDRDGRPCITINRIPQFVRQVTNAQRASNLAIKVRPVDSGADIKTAEVIQGLIRHIEQQSDAAVAYSTAGDHQATMGRGYWTVRTEYLDETSFDQVIKIRRVRNPLAVYVDPTAMEADGSDATYAFEIEDLSVAEFKLRFPKAKVASLEEIGEVGQRWQDWMPAGRVRIAIYWYIEQEPSTVHLVQFMTTDGTVAAEYPMFEEDLKQIPKDIPHQVTAKRPSMRRQVKHALISACEILEGNEDRTAGRDWPGKWIPIIPVIGDETDINGELDLRGMVRDAKEPQRLYNYQQSTLAETLAMVPRAPFVGYEGQFEGHKAKWLQANKRSYPYLEVKPFTIGTQPAPLPQRMSAGADIGAIMTAIQQADSDLKATMGLYEPSLGIKQSDAQSGKAIQALQKQGENANSNFLDNLSRAIRFTGRIIVDLIPHVYDVPRVVRITGTDNREKAVMVGSQRDLLPSPEEKPEGVEGIFAMGVGRYDIVVTAGPSLESKRQEAFEALAAFVQAYPAAFPVLGDLIMQSLDWPGAQAAAERLKRMLPPQAQDPEEGQNSPEQMAAQMQQMMAQLQQAGVTIQELQQAVEGKKLEIEAESKIESERIKSQERIADLKAQVDLIKLEKEINADRALALIQGEIDHLEQRLDHAHQRGMAAVNQQQAREQSANQRKAQLQDRAMERGDRTREQAREHAREDAREGREERRTTRTQARTDARADIERLQDREAEFEGPAGPPPAAPPQAPPTVLARPQTPTLPYVDAGE